jgi:exonuclease SbcD
LLDDPAYVLDQFVESARAERVDAFVIAGDIYDHAVPPADADANADVLALLDDVLSRLVVAVAIFEKQKLNLSGTLGHLDPVVLTDHHGEVVFHSLPYVAPTFARALAGANEITDHQSAMSHMVALLR